MIQSSLDTEYVEIPVSAVIAGTSHDPTGDVVSFAFLLAGTNPATGDWHTGSWSSGPSGYVALCLVGPGAGGVALAAGAYLVWTRIVDNPEIPIKPVARLTIY